MEITVKPQNEVFAFPKIETEADANYIDIKINNNNKMCIDKLLKYMGIDKSNLKIIISLGMNNYFIV